jgi:serpin B
MNKWLRDTTYEEAEVTLPKFTFISEFKLEKDLPAMGMTDAFDSKADFSGMTGGRALYISAVIHKAFVGVDEEGTEAAAATAVVVKPGGVRLPPAEPKLFKADHPFIFLIRHNATDEILFLGRVVNPKGE